MRRVSWLILLGTVWQISACAGSANSAAGSREITAEKIYSGQQCADNTGEGIFLIENRDALRSILSKPSSVIDGPSYVKEVDFKKNFVVHISMGERSSAGYGLDYVGAQLAGRKLLIMVDWQEPRQDMLVAQIITRPCIVLRIPQQGIEEIQVIDRDGRRLFESKRAN